MKGRTAAPSRGGTAILAMARVAAVAVLPALVVAALTWLGTTELSPPPLGSLAELHDWVAARHSVIVGLALVRLAAWAVAWVVLVVTVVGGAARLASAHKLIAITDRLTPSAIRTLIVRTAVPGLASLAVVPIGLVAGAGDPPPTSTPSSAPPGTAVLQEIPSDDDDAAPPTSTVLPTTAATIPPTTASTTPPTTTVPAPVQVPAPDQPELPTPAGGRPEPSPPAASAPAPVEPNAPDAPDTPDSPSWTVAPGESFWSIAEEHLADTRNRPAADDAEIAAYWRVLIAANRSLLADPGNPDLIYPGQVLTLPPV